MKTSPQIQLGKRTVAALEKRPYVIAEVGVNHEGDLDKAKKLIDEAAEGGADSVKFQAYKAEKIAVVNSPSYWDRSQEATATQFELFKKYDKFNYKEYASLARHCEKAGVVFSCTPFDFGSADFLNDLVPFFKISSSDITNIPFLRHIAHKKKPIILSTGAATLAEIDQAVQAIRGISGAGLSLMHCILNYPCAMESAHLNIINLLKNSYPDMCIGYSDHVPADPSMLTLTYAFLMGAVILEKHFTDDKNKKGNDHYHAMDKNDLKVFRRNIEVFGKLTGRSSKDYLTQEETARQNARRSIVSAMDLKAGDKISWENIDYKRPASGISPALADSIIGAELNQDLAADTPLQFSHFRNLAKQEKD